MTHSIYIVAFPISKEEAWYHRVYDYAQSERLIALTLFFAFFFLLVMGMQLFQQIQFVCVYVLSHKFTHLFTFSFFRNMTINETMHAPRYVHFWTADKKFINPFDRY